MFYVIDKKRFIREIEHNAKGKGKGVMNWFVSNNKILNLIYDVYGVTYICRLEGDDVDVSIKQYLDLNSQMYGFMEETDFFPKKEMMETIYDEGA